MFDAVRNNKRIVQIFLLLITLPFALWGVDSYVRNASDASGDVATIGEMKISQQEWQSILRERQDRLRQQMGGRFDSQMLDSPGVRAEILDGAVEERLLMLQAHRGQLALGDDQLREIIAGIPALQENGQFSKARYSSLLKAQGLTEGGFEARLRQDETLRRLASSIGGTTIVSGVIGERWLAIQRESREIAQAVLSPEMYVSQVKLSPDAAKTYYESNRRLFEVPEQIKVAYVVFNAEALAQQVTVSEGEIKAFYDANQGRYGQGEERRASHILIPVPKDAPEEQVLAAKSKADGLMKQLQANPGAFAKLAKEHSQDPGSAAKGGDLGFFGRGMMVKPFEDAAFALAEGKVSDVVRSDFGFHIIHLTGVKPAKAKALQDVSGEIAAELKRQKSSKNFGEAAETFSNMVYEQADSLEPVAEKLKLKVLHSDWVTKGRLVPPLNQPKVEAALFSDDAIKNGRNIPAVDVGGNTLISARVMEHKASTLRPFDEVRVEIEKRLVLDEALKLAAKDGKSKLELLAKGETVDGVTWSSARKVARLTATGLAPSAERAVFSAKTEKLPAFVGAEVPGVGFQLFRISAVERPAIQTGDDKDKQMKERFAQLFNQEDLGAYLRALKQRFPVKINESALEVRER